MKLNSSLDKFLDPKTLEKAGFIGNAAPFKIPHNIIISSLEYDSRNVSPGSLFFALGGLHSDGHDFISAAAERGALAIVHEKELDAYREGVTYIRVKDSRFSMSPIADSFYDHPSGKMKVIGVTGTEGKSTTVYLIYQLLKLLGKRAGFVSTVQHGDGKCEKWNSEHQTTPEAVTVQRLLAEMLNNGAEYAVLESSSHGLSKRTNRLGDVDFDAGVMTNVTHEHLEFHGSWEQYRSDKAELFRSLASFGVINADDKSAAYFAAAAKKISYTFSTCGAEADLSVRSMESRAGGNSYGVFVKASGETLCVEDSLSGAFNAGNVLAALLLVSNLLSLDIKDIIPLVPQLKPVRGRMTTVCRGQPFELMVDYAHTPSSFQAILPPLRKRLSAKGGRIICLFGSAGERDTQKRRAQGEIASRYSDIVILADEDPRGEDPMTILEDIAKGCEADSGCETDSGCEADSGCGKMIRGETLFLIPNRPDAIRKGISLAVKGDLLLLLGKGHENSIIYSTETISYDEIGEAEKALAEAGYLCG